MIIAIDPGQKSGAIIAGDTIGSTRFLKYPQTPIEWRDFEKHWQPGAEVFIEQIIKTAFFQVRGKADEWRARAQNIAAMSLNFDRGCWNVALAPFWSEESDKTRITELHPNKWRKIVFGTALIGKTKMERKIKELDLARERFPHLDWGRYLHKNPKNDGVTYGKAAACCLWLAGRKIKEGIDVGA